MASQDWFEKDFYATLGVAQDASEDEIKKAYRKLARTWHPDKNPGDAAAEQKFKDIGEAHQVLADPEQRQQYDAVRQMARGGARFGGGGAGGAGGFEDVFSSMFGGGGGARTYSAGGAGQQGLNLEDLLAQFGGAGGVFAYAAAATVHTSGFIATYLAALVLGNMNIPHRQAVRGFGQALGWLAQIGLFVLLGLLASPSRLADQLVPAIVVGFVLLLIARPASVLVSMTPFGFSWREQVFLSWAGLRGAVPVVLATVPLTLGASDTRWIFDLVFVLVIVFTLLQAPTLPFVAKRLGIDEQAHTVELEVENTPLTDLGADMLQVKVGPTSRLIGVRVYELRLPVGANVTLVVNGDEGYVPNERSVLRAGDQLLVVTKESVRGLAAQRIREVSAGGRLAGWRTDTGPDTEHAGTGHS